VPLPVESVLPEGALVIVHKVVFLVVDAFEGVGAGLSFLCLEAEGVGFAVSFAAPR